MSTTLSRSTDTLSRMEQVLAKSGPDRVSYFQLRHFVLDKEPTLQAKLWRCRREISRLKESLGAMKLEKAELEDRIKLAKLNHDERLANIASTSPNEFQKQRNAIHERQAERKILALQETLRGTEENIVSLSDEAEFYLVSFEQLSNVEKIRPIDDPAYQKNYWNAKLAKKIKHRLMLGMNLDEELLETVMLLDNDAPIKQELLEVLQTCTKADALTEAPKQLS